MRFYARRCYVQEIIDSDIAQDFIESYHNQGSVRINKKTRSLGIYTQKDSILLGVAQFCAPRTKKKQQDYSTELLRLCFKDNIRVIGGASKIIKFYIQKYNPTDIFTYQDTTGENGKVYEHCGFTLVSQYKKKQYLVTPGKTLEDSSYTELVGIPYAFRYGPDRILGTSLGEQFKEDGSRKTNIELFQDLGWTITETTGDKVYEWINPNISFYTYKITAQGSDKYYYGVSSIKKSFKTLSIEDCLSHDYYGSGGKKFQNWKKKYKKTLSKEVIDIFDLKSKAYQAEKELIGNSYKIDPLCLNSTSGGKGKHAVRSKLIDKEKHCSICQKNTTHRKNKCISCYMLKATSLKYCSKCKKEAKHVGTKCYSCRSKNTIRIEYCAKCKEETKHSKEKCVPCYMKKVHSTKYCNKCQKQTKHIGLKCHTCSAQNALSSDYCLKCEKDTIHIGEVCRRCYLLKIHSVQYCNDCKKQTKHLGKNCYQCMSNKRASIEYCNDCKEETKHQAGNCCKCLRRKSLSTQYCSLCRKETKHQGLSCYGCQSTKTTHSRWHKEKPKEGCRHCMI